MTQVTIGKIVASYYRSSHPRNKLVIYAVGAPTVPNDKNLLLGVEVMLESGVDVVAPDYLGFGRSGGVFTPENCIKSLLETYKFFRSKYSEIFFLGRSLGGAYVPLLPKYDGSIKKLILIYPALDQAAQGRVVGEESNEWFLEAISKDNNYKGVKIDVWWPHLNNLDGLSPMDNLEFLAKTKVFIGHGKLDKCINYTKSEKYYKKIMAMYPSYKDNFCLEEYETGDHGPSTCIPAIKDALKWFKIYPTNFSLQAN